MSRVAFEATTGNLVVPAELRSDPRRLQQAVCSDAALLDQLLQRNPTLAEAALSDSPDLLAALLGDARDGEAAARRDDPGRERRIAAANASLARLDRHHPELNVPVDAAKLPHAPCCLNGVALEAYVDTGCQASLVTPEGARRCGLDGEVEPRERKRQPVGVAQLHVAELDRAARRPRARRVVRQLARARFKIADALDQ